MAKIKVQSLTRLHTLVLLSSSPRHGYELIKELERELGKRISAGEIYPFLKELKKIGYVSVKETGERETKVYSLTSDGRKFVSKLITDLSDLFDKLISSSLVSCAHCGCKIYGKPYTAKLKSKEFSFCCRYCAEAFGLKR